jgi:hypothetical protein
MSKKYISNYKLGPLNINFLVIKYGEKYIKKGKKYDYILENTLYWRFRDFIFRNIMVPNKVFIDIKKLDKNIVQKLFNFYIFKKKPTKVLIGKNIKNKWNNYKLLDIGYNNKSSNNNITTNINSLNNRQSNVHKLYHEYLSNNVIKDNNSSLSFDDLWNDFKEWWFDITEKEYPPIKKDFLKYVELNFLKKSITNDLDFKGWDGWSFN